MGDVLQEVSALYFAAKFSGLPHSPGSRIIERRPELTRDMMCEAFILVLSNAQADVVPRT